MKKKLLPSFYILVFGILAIALFLLVANKFRLAEFQLSMIEMMLTILGIFVFAVTLTVWRIVIPLSEKVSKKDLKNI